MRIMSYSNRAAPTAQIHDHTANIPLPDRANPAAPFGLVAGLPVGDDPDPVPVPLPLVLRKGNLFVELASTIIQSFTTALPFIKLSTCSSVHVDVSRE
jgi:hypothetical protein